MASKFNCSEVIFNCNLILKTFFESIKETKSLKSSSLEKYFLIKYVQKLYLRINFTTSY